MHQSQQSHRFLTGGGAMGEAIRHYDWATTSLGEPGTWPQSLKMALRLLLSSNHPMFIWWGPRMIQFYNDAYQRSIGPERHPSALGQGGRECWDEIWDIIGPQIDFVMAGQGSTWHENQLVPITRNNRREDVYWTYSYNPIDDQDAATGVGGVLVICTETTNQVLAEQQRRAAELRWRELFDQAPGFTCILTGPNHVFEFANPAYCELVGDRALIGKTVSEALPEAIEQGFGDLLDSVYDTGLPVTGEGTLISIRTGNTTRDRYLDFVYQPIISPEGEVTGIFVDGYDVTERVHANQLLLEADKRKDEFLAMLAHELRNPLAPIRSASELLKASKPVYFDTQAVGDMIDRQVTQLTRLVDDLLDISRITQGKIELQRETLNVDETIRLAIESLQPALTEKQHDLNYEKSSDPLFVIGDATRLVQCVANVLHNAIKYTPSGGDISVQLRRVDDIAVIDISDNGTGIPPEMLPHIFDLFVQGSQGLARSRGGLGLGLSIVRRLVGMHGGFVTAFSEGNGKGSRVELGFPLSKAPVSELKLTPAADTGNAQTLKILIVDDNVDAADTLALLLQRKGHHTCHVYSAPEALKAKSIFPADVMILDIGLPDMNGYELARIIKSEGTSSKLVALTGYGKPEDIQLALDAGFDAHMTKPVALDELENMIKQFPRA